MIELRSRAPRGSHSFRSLLLRSFRCAAVALACSIPPSVGHAHGTSFTIEFAGPGAISASGSDYVVTITHAEDENSLPLGLDDFNLAYRALGGSITALDYAGTDAWDVLMALLDPEPGTHFDTAFSVSPPAVATRLDEITPFDPYDWKFPQNSTKTLHTLSVVPDSDDVRDVVRIEVTDQVDTFDIPWVQNGAPYLLSLVHRHSFGPLETFLPPNAIRRLRPRNLLPEGEMNGGALGDITLFQNSGFDSVLYSVDDIDASDSSGSALVQLQTTVDGASASLQSGCIPVLGNASYHTGAAINATIQAKPGTTGVEVAWFDDAACTSALATSARIDGTPGSGFFEVTQTVAAPATAQSARVQCTVVVTGTSDINYFSTCDSLYLPEPSVAASTLASLATLLGISAAAARGRRAQLRG